MITKELSSWEKHIAQERPIDVLRGPERVKEIAIKLGISKPSFPVIAVAGTNGKGSCVQTLATIWSQAGYRVGAFTSPHLFNIRERISLNQIPVSSKQWVVALEAIEKKKKPIFLILSIVHL